MKTSFPIGNPAIQEDKEEVRKTTYSDGAVVTNVGKQSQTFIKGQKVVKEQKITLPKRDIEKLMREPNKFTIKGKKVTLKKKT